MPRGSKAKYSSRQKRQAHHIEESYRSRGASRGRAERIGWATVNKQDGGARGGSAHSRKQAEASSRRTTSHAARSRSGTPRPTRAGSTRGRQSASRASH